MEESAILMPRKFSKPRMWQWRYWRSQLWKVSLYRWLMDVAARTHARLAAVPVPKPVRVEILMLRFRICQWEPGPYVELGLDVPGEKITLLRHMYCNRIVGIKVWG